MPRRRRKRKQNPSLLAALLAQRARHEAAAAAAPPPPPPPIVPLAAPAVPAATATRPPLRDVSRWCVHHALRAQQMRGASSPSSRARIADLACSVAMIDRRAAWSLERCNATCVAVSALNGIVAAGDARGNFHAARVGLESSVDAAAWKHWPLGADGTLGRACALEWLSPERIVIAHAGDGGDGAALRCLRLVDGDDEGSALRLSQSWALRVPETHLWSVASRHRSVLATGHGPTGIVGLVSVERGVMMQRWCAMRSAIWSCAWCDEHVLAVGSRTGTCQLWDTRRSTTAGSAAKWRASDAAVVGVVGIVPIDAGRRLLVSATSDSLNIWDARMGLCSSGSSSGSSSGGSRSSGSNSGPVLTLRGHTNSHLQLEPCVGPNERVVYSGGDDGRIRSWSATTGAPLHECAPVAATTQTFAGNGAPAVGLRCCGSGSGGVRGLWAATRDGVRVAGLRS